MDRKPYIIYLSCASLALFMGYLLASPFAFSTLAYAGVVASVLVFPLMLKWHHPLLVLSWNLPVSVFFLPGQPTLWLVLAGVGLMMSILERALKRGGALMNVPQMTWPLLVLVLVVLVTAKLTGLGLRSAGSGVYGGKNYVYLLGAVVGYFALSFQRIPLERAWWYIGLFFFSSCVSLFADIIPLLPPSLYFIYNVLPVNPYALGAGGESATGRLTGLFPLALAVYSYLVARYGLRGILMGDKPWRWLLLALLLPAGMLLGGFRSELILFCLLLAVQFYLEGLHRTRLLAPLLVLGFLLAVAVVPLARHLPYTAQRTLSFLPLDVDPLARRDAEASLEWRLEMWRALWPQVGEHFWLGKGYALSPTDFQLQAGNNAAVRQTFAENQVLALSGNYHSGPLSVILPFGIWGVLAVVWFFGAGIWLLVMNCRHGTEELRGINRFLLVLFGVRIIFFLFVFGSLHSDMLSFCGWLGLSVSLNGGVARPGPRPAPLANDRKKVPPKPAAPATKRPEVIPVTTQGNS